MQEWTQREGFSKIFLFASYKGEPDVLPLASIEQSTSSLTWALPVIKPERKAMKFYAWKPGDSFSEGHFGIKVSTQQTEVAPNEHTLILVPCLAADPYGFRLGYGAGYFDRYLDAHRAPTTCAVLFEDFMRPRLPREPHDIAANYICTEQGLVPRVLV